METITTKFEEVKKLSTEELWTALKDANDLCRAAYQIALRDGQNTEWKHFRDCLSESLERQHRVMYPKNKRDIVIFLAIY